MHFKKSLRQGKKVKPTSTKLELASLDRTKYLPLQQANLENFNANEKYLMDISSNMQWMCFVSLYDGATGTVVLLSIRKLTAFSEDTKEKGCFTPISNFQSSTPNESRLQMSVGSESSWNISEYFDASNFGHKFLSISPGGQHIALSTYHEEINGTTGNCTVFTIRDDVISIHRQYTCNGRAVFLNGRKEFSLAIINTETLSIYEDIRMFSEDTPYEIFDLKPFGKSDEDFECSEIQYAHAYFVKDWNILKDPRQVNKPYSKKVMHIIAMSKYIKSNILITPFTVKSDIIRFWSLKKDGIRIGSIFAPGEAVIAISEDSKYVATTANKIVDFGVVGTFLRVYNLEIGCLAYEIKTPALSRRYSHVTFSYNSRYLAESVVLWNAEIKERQADDYKATFQVWDIVKQTLIYRRSKNLIHGVRSSSDRFKLSIAEEHLLKPFVLEETAKGDRINLKGVYFFMNGSDRSITMRCFKIEMDDRPSDDVKWSSEFGLDVELNMTKLLKDVVYGKNKLQQNFGNKTLDELLHTYFVTVCGNCYESYGEQCSCEIRYNLSNWEKRVSYYGSFDWNTRKYLVLCGLNMMQLWEIEKVFEHHRNRPYTKLTRLVYVKPYINLDYRSCYLSPNVWRIKSLENIKVLGELPDLRVTVNIIEDSRYLREEKKELSSHTEELILPVEGSNDIFNYQVFEGACQALYLINIYFLEEKIVPPKGGREFADNKELKKLQKESVALIEEEIKKLDENCNSFRTIEGSKTLAMLASFQKGRDILKLLLQDVTVTFNISSYSVTTAYGADTVNLSEERRYDTAFRFQHKPKAGEPSQNQLNFGTMTESVLTVLIREREYFLYHIIFNRLLFDSKNAGPECLAILTDALLLLQEFGNVDEYKKSCQKLSYLRSGDGTVLPSDIPPKIPQKADYQEDIIANIRNIFFFSTLEQMGKLQVHGQNNIHCKTNCLMSALLYTASKCKKAKLNWMIAINYFRNGRKKPSNQFVICVVPLPYFNTYNVSSIYDRLINNVNLQKRKHEHRESYKNESLFLQLALDQHSEPNIWKQGNDVMAIILQYKWSAFIRRRFFAGCIIYVVYYVSYCTGVQFALEVYNYDSTNDERSFAADGQHVTSIVLFFLSGLSLLILEFKQIPKDRTFTRYFKSWYNYVDIAAVVLPVINFLQLRFNWSYFYEVTSLCALILWLHCIIRLRVFSSFGVALETILQLFSKVNSVLFVLLIVVLGFTHSFIALLRQQQDQYFQENYSGETSLYGQLEVAGNTTLYDLSSSNGFNDPFKAFYQVWLFIFGVWDPVTAGDAGDNRMLFILCMLFAFITVLIFTNMIIALMSSTVEEVKQHGKKVWMTHFAAVIAEIESLSSQSAKIDRKNNPAFIFYAGNAEMVKRQEQKLRQETQELFNLLSAAETVEKPNRRKEKLEQELQDLSYQFDDDDLKEAVEDKRSNDSVNFEDIHRDLQKIYDVLMVNHGNENQ